MNSDSIEYRLVPNEFGASLRGFLYAVHAIDGFNYLDSYIEAQLDFHKWKLSVGPYSSLNEAVRKTFDDDFHSDTVKCHTCGRQLSYITQNELLEFKLYYADTFDLHGGLHTATVGGRWIVNKKFAELYISSGLDGLLVSDSVEAYYPTDERRIDECRSLAPLGAIKPSTKYLPDSLTWNECSECGGRTLDTGTLYRLADNNNIFEASTAVLGCTWSGHDFCAASFDSSCFVYCTPRALDWLLSIHAGPFIYRSVDFLLKDTTHYHRHRIEQCKGNAILEYVKIA